MDGAIFKRVSLDRIELNGSPDPERLDRLHGEMNRRLEQIDGLFQQIERLKLPTSGSVIALVSQAAAAASGSSSSPPAIVGAISGPPLVIPAAGIWPVTFANIGTALYTPMTKLVDADGFFTPTVEQIPPWAGADSRTPTQFAVLTVTAGTLYWILVKYS